MSGEDPLARLAALAGIVPEYHDIWGQPHPVSRETRSALLAAMGIDTSAPGAVEHALHERETRPLRQLLPEVLVVWEGEQPGVPVAVPERLLETPFAWKLHEEHGGERRGEFLPGSLEREAEGEVEGTRHVRLRLPLALTPAPGYHRLTCAERGGDEPAAEMPLIVAPRTCYAPPALAEGGRVWGPAVQLYALRSHRDWGIGDLGDLARVTEVAGTLGAGVVGVNPLHALYPHNPLHASPYSPSSRLFLNVLYLDVEAIPELAECEPARRLVASPEFQARLAALRQSELVDYQEVAAAKREALERLYRHFREHHLSRESDRARAFRAFQAEGGEALERHALFEALAAKFRAEDAGAWGWPVWPPAYRARDAPSVRAFAAANRERVEFYQYLQWQAVSQLAAAGRRSAELGLAVGLYLDLAVSVDRGGAETWANPDLYAVGASIGSPPDDFNLKGQNWGLPPLIPERLRERAYAPFIATLRANMREAGALRIDHVMALHRLFWVPEGVEPAEGAYVRYPFRDLLGILALESRRNQCLVIGEDLGTVPDEVRAGLGPAGVLSYRLFYFEKDANGEFKAPEDYPAQALVTPTTHDLPTLAGFWEGRDLLLRRELGLFPSEEHRQTQVVARAEDRARILVALEREGLLPEGIEADPVQVPELTDALARAIHRYVARTPAVLMLFQPEDVFTSRDQVNLPGTTDEHPNWRRRLPLALEQWLEDERVRSLAAVLREERGPATTVVPSPAGGAPPEAIVPRATYRLQLNGEFTFAAAAELTAYLDALGVSHCYTSPYLKARPGSSHGYDIIDHRSLNPEIGSESDFERFAAALKERGMGQILDFVPNHMGVMGSDNAWWLDVLENGQTSPYAEYFDIDWRPVREELRNKVLLPVLGDHYGAVLERGDLALELNPERGELSVRYYEHRFPLDPATYPSVLGLDRERLAARLGREDGHFLELESLIHSLEHLPPHWERESTRREERLREREVCKRRLVALCQDCPAVAEYLATNVALLNGAAGHAQSFVDLHRLLERQAWRLAFWQVAADEINYRRFFDINDLAGLRMEHREVFTATHARVLEWLASGHIDGLRIDHPDGLYDPERYYRWLAEALEGAVGGQTETAPAPPRYVVAEKILAPYEHLPESWPVHGTTGYEFANAVTGLFVDSAGEGPLTRAYSRFVGRAVDFDELLYECKKLIIRVHLSSELTVLANLLNRIAQADWHTRDYTLNGLRDALVELVASFPVYRTYVSERGVSAEDRRYIDWAAAWAKKRSAASAAGLVDFVRQLLTLERTGPGCEAYRELVLAFAMKFQQYTAPVTAKALEDTSFYRYHRLSALNEVGGDPRRFGVSVTAFHHGNQERLRRWPHSMLASSTHDTKRSEDVRARLVALSELGGAWDERVRRWRRMNRRLRRTVDDEPAPSRNDEYLFYQTLVGVWPLEPPDAAALADLRERLEGYLIKACREAKAQTSWSAPNVGYEEAVLEFVRGVLAADGPFLADLAAFVAPIARLGLLTSLSQVALKLTSPGVPDIYQGAELWNFQLVDPDNRRAVDYGHRRRLLAALEARATDAGALAELARELGEGLADGRAKLYLIWRALALRREHPELFRAGDYQPLTALGARAEHLCAFARTRGGTVVVTVVGRLFVGLVGERAALPLGPEVWDDTAIEVPPGVHRFDHVLTARPVASVEDGGKPRLLARELFADFPVALLVSRA